MPPTPMGGELRFTALGLTRAHGCGLATDRRPYCWGDNRFGELGDSTTVTRLVPTPVLAP